MDRREQIRTAAEKASRGVGGNWEHIRKGAELWFIRGAIWADSHPNWIPVEDYEKDELPSLMDKEDQYGCSVSVLFVVNLDGINYINKGCFDYDTGVWHSIDTGLSYTKEQVTHWMPLPQAPRKEG